ncbi:type II toxin-antitoxin system RelE/ParE family toxin [Paenibacillus sp. EKM202P]|uniref:type II toxin-antitoxin system RelE/ParE family toxin n=1 Tax=unclassified Paenibacillus TaxID=185978 RepID=UPI0013EC5746|nr:MULTISPECIES: type II toxin-antitoxin system RelE/ParE family toxin [unclassified Paenibacillus]KAF6565462.1 type II toxin-antitoxin system RelE/ParE family toxin [Paenibacillus sp. EKM202P]KAF6569213.1 type II toxin-antitoxin system RelE/ParE family toxin [Paenibacillus sp. EKM207P]
MYEIKVTDRFEKDIKYYKRKKKYTNIDDDLDEIISELENGNFVGDEIPNLNIPINEHSYKVRAVNSNTKVGKSNGYRLIYYVIKDDFTIFLLTVYYKKDKENITNEEIESLIKEYATT